MPTIAIPPTQEEKNSDTARRRAVQDRADLQALSDSIQNVTTFAILRPVLRDMFLIIMRLAHRVAALEVRK